VFWGIINNNPKVDAKRGIIVPLHFRGIDQRKDSLMKTISYEKKTEIPVIYEADVVVVGAGPGGIGAAVAAARNGAKTVLVERYGFPGGMAVSGEVHPFMPNDVHGEKLDRPIYIEWQEKMIPYLRPQHQNKVTRKISKDAAVLAAEDLCFDAGVTLLYHHTLADVQLEGDFIDSVIFLSKSGLVAVKGSMYIDCTGDGDLAALAGCSFEQGGPSGHSQPMTLCFKLSQVDQSRVPDHSEINKLYLGARDRGEIDCPRDTILSFKWFDDDVVHFNTTRVLRKSGTNGLELSEAEIEGRKQLRQLLRFFRTHVPGFEQAGIHSIASHIGIRETRRICGLHYLERVAFDTAQKFSDAIARANYPIDIHHPDGGGTDHAHLPKDEWYEIPYGCIVAKDRNNLLVGGRPISVDHAVHSSMRVMPIACSVGQAAGVAAAMALKEKRLPRDLDGKEVRKQLVEMGARL